MNEEKVLQILGRVGAVITDSHIVYTSGKHGTAYVNKDAVFPNLKESDALAGVLARRFVAGEVEVVIGPAVAGALFARDVARELQGLTARKIRPVYAEKPEGGDIFVIKRGYGTLIAGKNVLVVEDVLTTGGSVKKVIKATRAVGGNVVGVGALCHRGGITAADVGLETGRLEAIVNITLDAWDEDECLRVGPCSRGAPINTDVGKGREFLARRRLI